MQRSSSAPRTGSLISRNLGLSWDKRKPVCDFLLNAFNTKTDFLYDKVINAPERNSIDIFLLDSLENVFENEVSFIEEINHIVFPQDHKSKTLKTFILDHDWAMRVKCDLSSLGNRLFEIFQVDWTFFGKTLSHSSLPNKIGNALLKLLLTTLKKKLPDPKYRLRFFIFEELLVSKVGRKHQFETFRQTIAEYYFNDVCLMSVYNEIKHTAQASRNIGNLEFLKKIVDYINSFYASISLLNGKMINLNQRIMDGKKVAKFPIYVEDFQLLGRYGKFKLNEQLLSILEGLKFFLYEQAIILEKEAELATKIAFFLHDLYCRRVGSTLHEKDNRSSLDIYMEQYVADAKNETQSSTIGMIDSLRKLIFHVSNAIHNAPGRMERERVDAQDKAGEIYLKVYKTSILRGGEYFNYPNHPNFRDKFIYIVMQIPLQNSLVPENSKETLVDSSNSSQSTIDSARRSETSDPELHNTISASAPHLKSVPLNLDSLKSPGRPSSPRQGALIPKIPSGPPSTSSGAQGSPERSGSVRRFVGSMLNLVTDNSSSKSTDSVRTNSPLNKEPNLKKDSPSAVSRMSSRSGSVTTLFKAKDQSSPKDKTSPKDKNSPKESKEKASSKEKEKLSPKEYEKEPQTEQLSPRGKQLRPPSLIEPVLRSHSANSTPPGLRSTNAVSPPERLKVEELPYLSLASDVTTSRLADRTISRGPDFFARMPDATTSRSNSPDLGGDGRRRVPKK